jgi:hypothetical protein
MFFWLCCEGQDGSPIGGKREGDRPGLTSEACDILAMRYPFLGPYPGTCTGIDLVVLSLHKRLSVNREAFYSSSDWRCIRHWPMAHWIRARIMCIFVFRPSVWTVLTFSLAMWKRFVTPAQNMNVTMLWCVYLVLTQFFCRRWWSYY